MKKYLLLATLFMLIISSLSACYLLPKEEESLEPPLVKPAEVEYTTQTAELGDIKVESVVHGIFKPEQEFTLFFEERGGFLLAADAEYGETVKAGDILFELDTGDMEMEQQIAALDLEKATLNFDRVKSRTTSVYDRRMAEIDMEIKQIAYDKITAEIEKSKICAPIDGIVTYMSDANIGDYVDAKTIMAKVADTGEFRLIVQGDDASKLSFGDTVSVEVTINKEKQSFEGQVVLSPLDMPGNTGESFEEPTAVIDIEGLDTSKLKINQDATITVVEQSAENVIAIRRYLVKNYYGRTFVYVLEGGIKVERDVETGIYNNTMIEIRDGLEVGDVIIEN